MNQSITKSKALPRSLKIAVLAGFLLVFIFATFVPAWAFDTYTYSSPEEAGAAGSTPAPSEADELESLNAIKVKAPGTEAAVKKNTLKRTMEQIKTWLKDKLWKELQNSIAAAYKAALKNFLNTLAYDMATYIATGDKGQLPMFYTQGWGGYLQNVADNAAGTFIEQLGKNMATQKFNLCNPDFRVLLRINLGLVQSFRPSKPACTFSQMTKNWDQALRDKDFLPKFQDMFNPWSNDLGIALTLQTGISSQIDKEVNAAIKDREEGKGFKAVTEPISKFIKTPASTVLKAAGVPIDDSSKNLFVYTGSVVADSVDIFINTLIGKLIEKWLRQGLVTKMPSLANKLDELTNPNAQNLNEGVAGAENRMRNLVEPSFKTRADYDILAELATCPDPTKAGPTNCVIDEKFRDAIERKMTVGEALTSGNLSGNWVFGFAADGPKFNQGYPYRSMIILRKYRIIPVGWEVAAQKIKDDPNIGTRNLADLVACHSDADEYAGYSKPWCIGLVDPNWVLKAPQNFCKREGAGGEIISQEVTGGGAGSSLAVLRNDSYCADEQSCIKEKADGSCQLYGYCTEERRKWDFNSKSCQPLYNTCQTFSSSAGQAVSYLENTLDFRVCNASNSGCLGYCQDYDYTSGEFTCKNDSGSKIYLNKQAETCDQASEGCHQLVRLNPGGGANLLVNSSFETENKDARWTFKKAEESNSIVEIDTSQGYDGGQSLKIDNQKENSDAAVDHAGLNHYSRAQQTISDVSPAEWITVSYYVKSNLTNGPHSGVWLVVYARDRDNKDIGNATGANAASTHWIIESVLTAEYQGQDQWKRVNFSFITPAGTDRLVIEPRVQLINGVANFDAIKVERGASATAYSDYAAGSSLIYEKLLPSYLVEKNDNGSLKDYDQGICYDAQGQLKVGAPAICANFVRRCSKDEAGCELYTGVESGVKIPAQVAAQDYCPAECLGYDTFVQSQTIFDSQRQAYLIPRTARACSAQAAGCDQFTNLDEKAKGGEGIEYYSSLRQCVKPGAGSNCAEFYYWQGSDESGFQLKVESLEKTTDNQPIVTDDDSALCNIDIYNKSADDPAYNADCRQFYNRTGGISYHLASRTIACTDDCHPYRRSENNELTVADCRSSCSGSDASCLASCNTTDSCSTVKLADNKNSCQLANGDVVLCKSGGVWSSENNACLYQAVPHQGASCSAEQNGCREYVGNTGNDVRQIFTDDFSDGTKGAWQGAVSASSEALALGPDNKGHSIAVNGKAWRRVGATVTKGKSYVLSFLAKGQTGDNLAVKLGNGMATSSFAATTLQTNWQIFEVNLASLNHEPNSGEILTLEAGRSFYITNITLREITDRYYLIKETWQDNCDHLDADITKAEVGDLYYVGCAQYQDRASQTHNLRQFTKLCSESAVGCELMIDTQNSSSPEQTNYNNIDGSSLTVPKDKFIYAVYDADKLCGAEDQGCQFLGQPYTYEKTALYGGVYLKNNPDKYNQILCGEDAVGCQTFAYAAGEKYFKDPGDQVCEWRQASGAGPERGWNWYQKKVKRCDDGADGGAVNGQIDTKIVSAKLAAKENKICLADSDCSVAAGQSGCKTDADCRISGVNECEAGKCAISGNQCNTNNDCVSLIKCVNSSCHYTCLTDANDYACSTSNDKTLGFGGLGNLVYQPAQDENKAYWAGLCPAEEAGCTEYLEPLSRFNTNLIFNGSFQALAGSNTAGWSSSGLSYTQNVTLEPKTVYRLARNNKEAGQLTIDSCTSGNGKALREINSNNVLLATAASLTVNKVDYNNSRLFYYNGNDKASCQISVGSSGGAVELKPVAIDYQLSGNVDKQSCNGQVDTGQGCVLFNERKQNGSSLASLTWDADRTSNGVAPALPENQNPAGQAADKDTNVIIKVAPDRTCDKWLACKSYIKDGQNNVCFDLGLCDAVDENGDCQDFLASKKENQLVGAVNGLDAWQISNLSGYSKVGIENGSLKTDYYPLGAMEQKGEIANLSNGGFEFYGTNLYPIGWNWSAPMGVSKSWDANIFSVVNNPVAAQTEGTGYAPEGASFLKLGSSYSAESELIDVMPYADYVITAYLNTINLKSGQAAVDIENDDVCQANNKCQKNPTKSCSNNQDCARVITQALGNGWQFQMGKFRTGSESQIKVKLSAVSAEGATLSSSEGNFYYDDIKIKPALNSETDRSQCLPGYCISDSGGDTGHCSNDSTKTSCLVSNDKFWYTPQSCRLYPKNDSLSCDYYEDSGVRDKGWPGYCLEYDRPPGDPDVCLLWYPVDKVKGDGIEEGAGYTGRAPLFYCAAGVANKAYEYRHAYIVHDTSDDAFNYSSFQCDSGYKKSEAISCWRWHGDNCDQQEWACIPQGEVIAKDGSHNNFTSTASQVNYYYLTSEQDGWYAYNGSLLTFKNVPAGDSTDIVVFNSNPYVTYLCSGGEAQGIEACPPAAGTTLPTGETCACVLTKELFRTSAYCSNVAQTVTAMGQNKYWASRVYQNSDYPVPNLRYTYDIDAVPFGSMVTPSSSYNPYDWDGDVNKAGNQPITYSNNTNVVRAGKGYGCSTSVSAGEGNNCKFVADDSSQDNFPYAYQDLPVLSDGVTGTELIKRLFAQSYGQWSWEAVGLYQCSAGTTGDHKAGDNCAGQLNDCPNGSCSPGSPTSKDVCSYSGATCNKTPCSELSPPTVCVEVKQAEYRCNGQLAGDRCCRNGTLTTGVISCSGLECKPVTTTGTGSGSVTKYRCGGVSSGALCCPSGQLCDVCNSDGSIWPSGGGKCQTGLTCRLTDLLPQGYGTCDGTAGGQACCLASEGDCITRTIAVSTCLGGLNNGKICSDQYCQGGTCEFKAGGLGEHYMPGSSNSWSPPATKCNDTGIGARPTYIPGSNNDYCAILPTVTNVQVNGLRDKDVQLTNSQFIKLSFNTKVDSQQLPLVMYGVDWGDNSQTVVTGVEMRDRPEESGSQEEIYHLYSYWDLKAKNATDQSSAGGNTIYCGAAGEKAKKYGEAVGSGPICTGLACCAVRPKIQIKDNWGWCNHGTSINVCDDVSQWDNFEHWIVVKEK